MVFRLLEAPGLEEALCSSVCRLCTCSTHSAPPRCLLTPDGEFVELTVNVEKGGSPLSDDLAGLPSCPLH